MLRELGYEVVCARDSVDAPGLFVKADKAVALASLPQCLIGENKPGTLSTS